MRRFVQAFSAGSGFPTDLTPAVRAALETVPDRYNVGANQRAHVLRPMTDGTLSVTEATWGMVPRWSKTESTRYTTVTARLERVATSRVSRHAWQEQQRCVLPLTGYYKWDRSRKPYRPWFVHARDGSLLLAAGLWECWEGGAVPLLSFSVLTRPNDAIPAPLVADGPVFLGADAWRRWLDGAKWFPQSFLQRTPQPALAAYPVSRAVQDAARDDYTLLEPASAEPERPVARAGDAEDDDENFEPDD